jgi:diguanylate cyclase (GGDEF)-like protein/PAS domain S-box-containing protein
MKNGEFINKHFRIEELFESMPIALAVVNREAQYIVVNKVLASLGGVFSADLVGKKAGIISDTAEQNIYRDFDLFDKGLSVPDHELIINERYYQVSVSPICDKLGFAFAEMIAITDVTKMKKIETQLLEANEKLSLLSNQDPLTTLLNARGYYEKVEANIKCAHGPLSYVVFFIDIDCFKQINDIYGHDIGDLVLIRTALTIKNFCKDKGIAGRIGGDEFSVFLPETDYEQGRMIAEKLRFEIEKQTFNIENRSLKITASIGVSVGISDEISIREVQSKADYAMYTAKKNSGNKVSGIL